MKEKTSLYRIVSITLIILLALISVVSLAGCVGQAAGQAEAESTAPFYSDRVVTVRFDMADEDWEYLRKSASEESYVQADMWYDGELIPDIAIRPKGNSSLASTIGMGSIKFGLKVDLNLFNAARNLGGVKKFNFNNGFSDPTFIKETLSYELFEKMGIPTPRSVFVDVWVNDTHLGLYNMVEQIDKTFLARYFLNPNGNLFKPEMPASYLNWTEKDVKAKYSQPVNTSNLEVNIGGGNLADIMDSLGKKPREQESARNPFGFFGGVNIFGDFARDDYLAQMSLKTNENQPDFSALYRLLDILRNEPDGTFSEEIEKVLDVDEVLRYLAVSTVLVHLDNYIGMGHNYYLYEVDGKFTILPWDLNMSFGGFSIGYGDGDVLNFFIDEPVSGTLADRPLVARLLAIPEYLEIYHSYLVNIIDVPFSSPVMTERIDSLADLIRPYVKADTHKFFSTADFEKYIGEYINTARKSPFDFMQMGVQIGLKTFVSERIESIKKQLSGEMPATNNGKGNKAVMFMGGW